MSNSDEDNIPTEIVIDPETAQKIVHIDESIIGDVIGLSQAVAALRAGLNRVDSLIRVREFEQLSAVGYNTLGIDFIFLQRILGGMQTTLSDKEKLICGLAFKHRRPYEDVEPVVEALMDSCKPRPEPEDQVVLKWSDHPEHGWWDGLMPDHRTAEWADIRLMHGRYRWKAGLTGGIWVAGDYVDDLETAKTCAQRAIHKMRKIQKELLPTKRSQT